MNPWLIRQTVDLQRGAPILNNPDALMHRGDRAAHKFLITVQNGGQNLPLDGASATGYFDRADGVTVPISGTVSGSTVEIVTRDECYAVPGPMLLLVRLQTADRIVTLMAMHLMVGGGPCDAMVDPGHIIPSIDDLLAKIEEMEAGTREMVEATGAANGAADRANQAAGEAEAATERADTAANQANAARDNANRAAQAWAGSHAADSDKLGGKPASHYSPERVFAPNAIGSVTELSPKISWSRFTFVRRGQMVQALMEWEASEDFSPTEVNEMFFRLPEGYWPQNNFMAQTANKAGSTKDSVFIIRIYSTGEVVVANRALTMKSGMTPIVQISYVAGGEI